MDRDVWSSHQWASARGRQVEIESGNPLVQRHCTRCARDFVEDPASGERHGVFVSVFSFRMLPDHINQQWLAEMCPGAPLPIDVAIPRQTDRTQNPQIVTRTCDAAKRAGMLSVS